jgi:hypothetical protein
MPALEGGHVVNGKITVINRYKFVAQSVTATRLYVGRPTTLGNPYRKMSEAQRARTVEQYEEWLRYRMRTRNQVRTEMERLLGLLQNGQDLELECSCAPRACHADIIKKVLEEMLEGKHVL